MQLIDAKRKAGTAADCAIASELMKAGSPAPFWRTFDHCHNGCPKTPTTQNRVLSTTDGRLSGSALGHIPRWSPASPNPVTTRMRFGLNVDRLKVLEYVDPGPPSFRFSTFTGRRGWLLRSARITPRGMPHE